MELVPQTVVVGPDGAIRKAMAGVLSTTNVADFATALKGLSAVSLGR